MKRNILCLLLTTVCFVIPAMASLSPQQAVDQSSWDHGCAGKEKRTSAWVRSVTDRRVEVLIEQLKEITSYRRTADQGENTSNGEKK